MTFSIVARDPRTGELGVATTTAGPFVGVLVPHVQGGVAAVATQAMTNPYLALDVLAEIGGLGAAAALEGALARDAGRERRQVVLVDAAGAVAGWTGSACEHFAGHRLGDGVAVAGNILAGPPVLDAMLSAFESTGGVLGARLLAALLAGAAEGGDRRGLGSAALRVGGAEAYAALDLRVDRADAPLAELAELLRLATEGGYAQFHAALPRRFPGGRGL